jgi:nucleotide-binding universal stress UspA family protein
MRRSYIAAHDGTERGADAVALARILARPSGMPVRMVHVCPAREPWHALAAPGEDPTRVERARVLDVEERLRLPGDPLPLNLTAPSVAHGLHDAAEREPAAVVVIASSPGGDPQRTHPGTTAERLLHGSPCTVAVAPEGYAARGVRDIRVVGVAIDADPESDEALRRAIELARSFGARVRILTAVDPAAEAEALALPEASADVREAVLDRADVLLRATRAGMPQDVGVETALCVGDPGPAIVAACNEDVDLLVCGSRRYGPRRAVLLGTIAEYLVTHARCPVLDVPRAAAAPGPRPRAMRATTEPVGV